MSCPLSRKNLRGGRHLIPTSSPARCVGSILLGKAKKDPQIDFFRLHCRSMEHHYVPLDRMSDCERAGFYFRTLVRGKPAARKRNPPPPPSVPSLIVFSFLRSPVVIRAAYHMKGPKGTKRRGCRSGLQSMDGGRGPRCPQVVVTTS